MSLSLVEQYVQNDEDMRLFQQEKLILEFTESICKLMMENEVSRAELAIKLGTSNAHITQLLNGTRNMTLRTASDLAWALKKTFHVEAIPITIHARQEHNVWICHSREKTNSVEVHFVERSGEDDNVQRQWKGTRREICNKDRVNLSVAG